MNYATEVDPGIRRLHPELDERQLELIGHLDGPLLGIAGPGSGKTLTIVLRAVNLLLLGVVEPRELLLCTYSRAAARELRQRFNRAISGVGYRGDPSRVRITTLHGLCGRLFRPHSRRVGLRSGFHLMNEDERRELLDRHFDEVFGPDLPGLERGRWRLPATVVRNSAKYFDRISDELIDPWELVGSRSRFKRAVGRSYLRYVELLLDRNLADFAHLQRWAVALIHDAHEVGDEISAGIRHLLCDEYQDTSHAQERLLRRLARAHGNLCVVGDDDQSLYRFRGADVGNILEFPSRFPDCRVVRLTVNYRSHPSIVHAYDRWMASSDWSNPDPNLPPFRHDKTIVPRAANDGDYPAVISIGGNDPWDEEEQLVDLLRFLKRNRVIGNYSQVALLLHSVREEVAGRYLDALDEGGIPAAVARARPLPLGSGRHGTRDEVVVTTMHRSKGLEWDVAVVGSLDIRSANVDPVGRVLLPHTGRRGREPSERIAGFDHMRQHYVGFSRARRLLVLSAFESPRARFGPIWNAARRWTVLNARERRALARQRFRDNAARGQSGTAGQRSIPGQQVLDLTARRVRVRMGPRNGQGALSPVTRT